jgi:hypothetical protein
MAQGPNIREIPARNTKIATLISDGERIVRNIIRPATRGTDQPRVRRREIDAGPVNEEASDTGETLPPDYEQVSRNQNRAQEGEPSRGTGLNENSAGKVVEP